MTDRGDLSPEEQAAQEGAGSGDEGYNGPEPADGGYNATDDAWVKPVGSLPTCRICGHVHDPEDGRCDVHAYVGIGCCPCPGEAALAGLLGSAQEANDAMRTHNRGGMTWRELDGIFAGLEAAIKRVRFVTRADA